MRQVERRAADRTETPRQLWYAAYGSNVHPERLRAYLAGGRPRGASRWYPGCRDRAMPAESVPVELPGVLYFATTSPVWGGGRAFYDPRAEGRTLAVAHLVTAGQFSDIAAQEMYREPGTDLDLSRVLARGRDRIGAGRYQTLVYAGELAGRPVLTCTAPWRVGEVPHLPPAAAYLRFLATGLLTADGGWSAAAVAEYLAGAPGAERQWSAADVLRLMA
ncbi:histone deacetylase [Streptomyces sp. WMMB303]|uniref:histone deacetylase n=1 Tax=Streptomyces sp. WMMB303 TaxID=3034154 RepID=UPI0023ED85BD|nr:histone deacetylase [Streptomyces sp. WMMB303]MDF4254333.1 histone deacetylase [Streptomyces sp. WMMB303]